MDILQITCSGKLKTVAKEGNGVSVFTLETTPLDKIAKIFPVCVQNNYLKKVADDYLSNDINLGKRLTISGSMYFNKNEKVIILAERFYFIDSFLNREQAESEKENTIEFDD